MRTLCQKVIATYATEEFNCRKKKLFIQTLHFMPIFSYEFNLIGPKTRSKQVFLPSSTHFSSIMQPSFPKVTIANLSLGNLKIIETSALGIDDASVQACQIVTHKS